MPPILANKGITLTNIGEYRLLVSTVLQTVCCVGKSFRRSSRLKVSQISGFVWISPICVEQQDVAERAQRVSVMGRIHVIGEEVIVWLGKDKTDIMDIKCVIRDLWAMVDEKPEIFFKAGLMQDTNRMAKDDTTEMVAKVVGAMRFISRRRWFSRAWIVREVTLSESIRVLVVIPCSHGRS
jgi:hypothetical protein